MAVARRSSDGAGNGHGRQRIRRPDRGAGRHRSGRRHRTGALPRPGELRRRHRLGSGPAQLPALVREQAGGAHPRLSHRALAVGTGVLGRSPPPRRSGVGGACLSDRRRGEARPRLRVPDDRRRRPRRLGARPGHGGAARRPPDPAARSDGRRHGAQARRGGAPRPSLVLREHGSDQPGHPGHQRSRADDERRARRGALGDGLRPRLAGLPLRPGREVVGSGDGAYPAGVPRRPRAGRHHPHGSGGRRGVPDGAKQQRPHPIRSGDRASTTRRRGEPIQDPLADRDGHLPEGRQAVSVRAAPVLASASLDAGGGAPLPGDRPQAGGRADLALDAPQPEGERGEAGRSPAHRARRPLGTPRRGRPDHLVGRDLPDLRARPPGTADRLRRLPGSDPSGRPREGHPGCVGRGARRAPLRRRVQGRPARRRGAHRPQPGRRSRERGGGAFAGLRDHPGQNRDWTGASRERTSATRIGSPAARAGNIWRSVIHLCGSTPIGWRTRW